MEPPITPVLPSPSKRKSMFGSFTQVVQQAKAQLSHHAASPPSPVARPRTPSGRPRSPSASSSRSSNYYPRQPSIPIQILEPPPTPITMPPPIPVVSLPPPVQVVVAPPPVIPAAPIVPVVEELECKHCGMPSSVHTSDNCPYR